MSALPWLGSSLRFASQLCVATSRYTTCLICRLSLCESQLGLFRHHVLCIDIQKICQRHSMPAIILFLLVAFLACPIVFQGLLTEALLHALSGLAWMTQACLYRSVWLDSLWLTVAKGWCTCGHCSDRVCMEWSSAKSPEDVSQHGHVVYRYVYSNMHCVTLILLGSLWVTSAS